jgi:phospholipid/cholesterol/gamma-HCH transport system substrate-binding protein
VTSRFVKAQLTVFVVVTLVGVLYALVSYVKLPQILGYHRYTIGMELSSAGGLYPQANVTLRGVTIGQVKSVSLTPSGVKATLEINDGVRVPTAVAAQVRNTSAIGEQYVDLIPDTKSGPYYPRHGATIPASQTIVPIEVNTVLENVNALVASLPTGDLRNAVNQLYAGLDGNGVALQRIVDMTQLLVHTGNENITPTTALISDAQQVLATQQATQGDLRGTVSNLAAFTQQLVGSDHDIRTTIDQAAGFSAELTSLFQQLQPVLPSLLANVTSVGQVAEVYDPALQHVITVLPATNNELLSDAQSTPDLDGQKAAKLNFKAAVNTQYCTSGFADAGAQRDPADLSLAPIPTSSYCKEPQSSQDVVRGARNAQCPNNAALRSASAAGCGLIFDPGTEPDGTAFSLGVTGSTPSSSAAQTASSDVATYDPLSGLALLPNGDALILGNVLPGGVPKTWQGLVSFPIAGLNK